MTFLDYLSNAHTHSHLSDGHNTLEDMVKKAFDSGYISIGITDHSPVFYSNNFEIKSIDEYVEKVCQIKWYFLIKRVYYYGNGSKLIYYV
jgi:histidinol phosphatase-like PHP family hydrolase